MGTHDHYILTPYELCIAYLLARIKFWCLERLYFSFTDYSCYDIFDKADDIAYEPELHDDVFKIP